MISETKKEFWSTETKTLDSAIKYILELEVVCEARYNEMVRLQNCNLKHGIDLVRVTELLREANTLLDFYSRGGNANMDVWKHEELGFFTGKRAREFLANPEVKEVCSGQNN